MKNFINLDKEKIRGYWGKFSKYGVLAGNCLKNRISGINIFYAIIKILLALVLALLFSNFIIS